MYGSDQFNVEFTAGVLFTDKDLEKSAWFLLPSNESFRSQGLSWYILAENWGRYQFVDLIKFHYLLITCDMCQLKDSFNSCQEVVFYHVTFFFEFE